MFVMREVWTDIHFSSNKERIVMYQTWVDAVNPYCVRQLSYFGNGGAYSMGKIFYYKTPERAAKAYKKRIKYLESEAFEEAARRGPKFWEPV